MIIKCLTPEEKSEKLLRLVQLRKHVYLFGKGNNGKTTIAQQVIRQMEPFVKYVCCNYDSDHVRKPINVYDLRSGNDTHYIYESNMFPPPAILNDPSIVCVQFDEY